MKRLSFGLTIVICGMSAAPVWGQSAIVPDSTLGASNSTIQETTIRGLPSTLIQGGSSQGANLFHSFLRFNVPVGRGAYFANPDGIKNIFSRVTGAERSEIFGRLGVLGDANLFLMNPNGILFGQTGSLDVNGSFVATTANAIQFGDRGSFDTTNPPNSVLTIDPSAFLFTQVPIGKIVNRSIALAGTTPAGLPEFGLRVPDGKSLLLVGGDIEIDNGRLNAFGGWINLSGLAESGFILVNQFRLTVPQNQLRSNLSLANDGRVAVRGAGGGTIAVDTKRLTATGGGRLVAGVETTGEVGNILVNAEKIELLGVGASGNPSGFDQAVLQNATGRGGVLIVNAEHLKILDGARVYAYVLGAGQGGNVQITAKTVDISGENVNGFHSRLGTLATTSTGNAGNVNVVTNALRITNGASLSTLSFGTGGGNIQIKADSIEVIGRALNSKLSSSLSALTREDGNAGDMSILTRLLSVRDGAFLSTSSLGRGRGGKLQIVADNIDLAGSGTFLGSIAGRSGDAGDVDVLTRTLKLRDGASLSTDSEGSGKGGVLQIKADSINLIGANSSLGSLAREDGNAGNVSISTGSLRIQDGAFLATSSLGTGQGGILKVRADSIELEGTSFSEAEGRVGSSFLGSLAFRAGNAGNTSVITRLLSIRNGASLSTSSVGAGAGGTLEIRADLIELVGLANDSFASSGLRSQAYAEGNAGDITVLTRLLSIRDGATLSTATYGKGRGGALRIEADSIELIGDISNRRSAILSFANATGDAGSVNILTKSFYLHNGVLGTSTFNQGQAGNLVIKTNSLNLNRSLISSQSQGQGNAGDIQIEAIDKLYAFDSRIISSSSLQTAAGTINLSAGSIRLRGNSDILTETLGLNLKGSDINLTARDYILALEDSDIVAFSANGLRGNITFNTPAFFSPSRFASTLNQSSTLVNGNNQVDVFGSGAIAGVPDITFLQNALNPLTQSSIDTNTLLANSCIVRDRTTGAFFIKGSSGLPIRPGDLALAPFPTGTIQPTERSNSEIVEPQGIYQLADGRYIMSRECQ